MPTAGYKFLQFYMGREIDLFNSNGSLSLMGWSILKVNKGATVNIAFFLEKLHFLFVILKEF